jgi:hypothetical protein
LLAHVVTQTLAPLFGLSPETQRSFPGQEDGLNAWQLETQ